MMLRIQFVVWLLMIVWIHSTVTPARACKITVHLDGVSQTAGNKGTRFDPVDVGGQPANFRVRAGTQRNPGDPFNPLASGLQGTVCVGAAGTGTQSGSAEGSCTISGTLPDADEELTFIFDAPVAGDTLVLGLEEIDFVVDDPVLFVSLAGSGEFGLTITEGEIQAAFTSTGATSGTLSFSSLASLPAGSALDVIRLRETNGALLVSSLSSTPAIFMDCPADMTVPCAGPGGVAVTFSVTATGGCGSPVVNCVPPSGSVFPVGTTTVTCTGSDEGGSVQCSFDVTVQDTTAPTLNCPGDMMVECTNGNGAVVNFNVSAVDDCDPNPSVTAVPPSGSQFGFGTTTVTGTAVDATGNTSQCSFDVIVQPSVLPACGSRLGDDHVNIFGCNFTDPATMVFLDAEECVVRSVDPNHIVIRTPAVSAGVGVVDVTLVSSTGTVVMPQAFTYLDPVLAARLGNMNVARGDREDTLLLNGGVGDAERIVDVAPGAPFTLEILPPSSRAMARLTRYCVWAWIGLSDISTLTGSLPAPFDFGRVCFPPPYAMSEPSPRGVFNLLGHEQLLGGSTFPSDPAPHVLFTRPGRMTPITVTFQGLERDNGSRLGIDGFSVTNAIALRIQ